MHFGDVDEIELVPAGHKASETFKLRASLGWRSVLVRFEPGAYAAALIEVMKNASPEARSVSESVLAASVADGAELRINVDGMINTSSCSTLWNSRWENLQIQLARGQLNVNAGNPAHDTDQLVKWTSRLAAAMFALMPLEAEEAAGEDLSGYPEGAKVTTTVNSYERDRRNRAAALAIHGYRCKSCERLMADEYGEIAITLIEVHHVTPVSALGPGYLIDPSVDLVPLCPNCHSAVHLRNPPLKVEELRSIINEKRSRSW